MTPVPGSPAGETRLSKTPSQTVAVNVAETGQESARRFQLEMSECVETKTVTTTTRLTRKFPHVFVRNPTPLECLDSKEYPLALKPAPPEIADFSYNMPFEEDIAESIDTDVISIPSQQSSKQVSEDSFTSNATKPEPFRHGTPTSNRVLRPSSVSPSEAYPRRSRQTRSQGATSEPSGERRQARNAHLKAVSDKLRRSIAHGSSNTGASSSSAQHPSLRQTRGSSSFLATPDSSEIVETSSVEHPTSSRTRNLHLSRTRNSPEPLQSDVASPIPSESNLTFSSNVATPPITDADAEPLTDSEDMLRHSTRHLRHSRPSVDVVAAQDASLPSPRLSPTLAAAQLHSAEQEMDDGTQPSSFQTTTSDGSLWMDESQIKEEDEPSMELVPAKSRALTTRMKQTESSPVVVDPQMLLEAFDSMKPEMKTFMMYQFLRRCARPTLRVVANAVNPALKCDFFFHLPLELSYHILSYLGHQDLCRAAQVSRNWRNIVDRNETGWKELFDRDGYQLPVGELAKAITQGWGWQDPVGATGFEKDLSMQSRLTSSEYELTKSVRQEAPKSRTASKRKRGLNTYSASERSKRRASAQDATSMRDDKSEVKQHRSAGPLSAANSAAAAVPDPHLGLSSLRQLHLFKSLYRRHHMIRRSWTSGEVRPAHVAFAAHPRHVITCLQFDEDKIITGSDDTFIHVYDTKTGKLRNRLVGHEGGVWALQYEGNILVSGSTDRSVRVWDIERGICQQVFYGHTSTVRCLQILMPTQTGKDASGKAIMQPEKPLIITGSRDSQLRVWRLPEVGSKRYYQTSLTGSESDCPYFIRALIGHSHSVRAISAHGDTLVSGSYDSVVRVWRISTGECVHTLHGHSQKVYSVVLDHERNRCISGSMDSLVKIWDLTTGACLYTLEGHTLLVGLLDLRDERLVSAAADSTLRIWDPETGRCKNTLMAHTGAITCFQHDGSKVISGSEKTVKMWDVKTGECIQDLLTDLSGVWQVKFDGRRCVAAVQRDQLTYVEILDFGAVRDGQPPEELGRRVLLNEDEVQAIMEEEA
uniref:F-box domain-containing protein n=1 Tax=Bionectria ochroleuca TaxID=29856 RepID=A0A0B7JML5_BIOOC